MQLRFTLRKISLTLAALGFVAGLPALAFDYTLCPSTGSLGGFGGGSVTNVASPGSPCGANSGTTLTIPDTTDYNKIYWSNPGTLNLGNIGSSNAVVSLTQGTDDPFYLIYFYDSSLNLGQTNPGDELLLLEFQPSTLAGTNMALDPNSTEFNLYDNTTGIYLGGGQSSVHTLKQWDAMFPSLGNVSVYQIGIGLGLAGGSGGPESLNVDYLALTQTPEPSSLALLGTGLVAMAGWGFYRRRSAMV